MRLDVALFLELVQLDCCIWMSLSNLPEGMLALIFCRQYRNRKRRWHFRHFVLVAVDILLLNAEIPPDRSFQTNLFSSSFDKQRRIRRFSKFEQIDSMSRRDAFVRIEQSPLNRRVKLLDCPDSVPIRPQRSHKARIKLSVPCGVEGLGCPFFGNLAFPAQTLAPRANPTLKVGVLFEPPHEDAFKHKRIALSERVTDTELSIGRSHSYRALEMIVLSSVNYPD